MGGTTDMGDVWDCTHVLYHWSLIHGVGSNLLDFVWYRRILSVLEQHWHLFLFVWVLSESGVNSYMNGFVTITSQEEDGSQLFQSYR